jgi:predicted CXXCH cytochrome family protein
MLKKDPLPALCADCHKDVLKGSHVHEPAAADCLACHKAHDSDHAKLLTLDPRPLCISCHAEVGRAASGSAHPHKPAEGDCLQCHAPHASDQVKVLKAAPAELCLSCHADVGKAAAAASHPHSAVSDVRACLNCHTAHGSEHAKLLPKDTVGTCLECHAKPIPVDKDRIVQAVAELADPKLHKHGPIAKDDCSGCHGVHGANLADLLHKPYATGFYQPFTDDAYALCFNCHDRALATVPTAEKETGFRDGTRNLHWLHVAKSPQGRSCRACHTVHASRFEAQIADTVTFGQWKLPINYTPTERGGSCSPGCHATAKYDRVMAAKPAPAAPTLEPKK